MLSLLFISATDWMLDNFLLFIDPTQKSMYELSMEYLAPSSPELSHTPPNAPFPTQPIMSNSTPTSPSATSTNPVHTGTTPTAGIYSTASSDATGHSNRKRDVPQSNGDVPTSSPVSEKVGGAKTTLSNQQQAQPVGTNNQIQELPQGVALTTANVPSLCAYDLNLERFYWFDEDRLKNSIKMMSYWDPMKYEDSIATLSKGQNLENTCNQAYSIR